MASSPPHIAILPSPGMGHLIPLVELAKTLHRHHGVTVTLILPTDGPLSTAQKSFLSSLPPSAIDYILLPPVSFDDLPDDVQIETRISLTVTRSLPSIRDAVKSLRGSKGVQLAALVVDLFGTDAFDVAVEFEVPKYIMFPSTATLLSLMMYLPEMDAAVSCEYREVAERWRIPGCVPIHGRDLLDPVQDRKGEAYRWVLHHAKRYEMAEGIMVNTFEEMEPGPIEALRERKKSSFVYPIGPLIQMGPKELGSVDDGSSVCLKWLGEQPKGSVLYVSFGSGGTLSHDQMIELALGLEMSEQRFLWVVRSPSSTASNTTYFSIENSGDPLAYLPEGFVERTRGQGLVVPLWAPQAKILAHGSTSGFLTHCGWNSTLESVVNGVPMIAWPLYAEQRMNAVMLHENARVALRPEVGENGLVGRVEVANVVKDLMEGEEGKAVRSQIKGLKDAAAEALSENGSSLQLLGELVNKWKGDACV